MFGCPLTFWPLSVRNLAPLYWKNKPIVHLFKFIWFTHFQCSNIQLLHLIQFKSDKFLLWNISKVHYEIEVKFTTLIFKQECIPVGFVPPTAITVPGGGSPPGTPFPPEQTPPRPGIPPGEPPPRSRSPRPGTPRDQASPQRRPPLWTEFLTHASENITLPQTSFGNYTEMAT